MDEMEQKIATLPKWAQQHIKHLKAQPALAVEQVALSRRQVEALKRTVAKLKSRCETMTEIFSAAAKHENETAKEFVARMFEEYRLEPEDTQ